jgi:hypothetical protein
MYEHIKYGQSEFGAFLDQCGDPFRRIIRTCAMAGASPDCRPSVFFLTYERRILCTEDPPLVQNSLPIDRRTLPAAETANGDGLSPAQGHRNHSRRSEAGSTQANLEKLADDCLTGEDLHQIIAALGITLHDRLGSVFFGEFTCVVLRFKIDHPLHQIPVSVLRQPLLRTGRSPRITRFGSSWRTDRTHQGVLQARRWGGPRKTSAEFEGQEC